MIWKLCLLLLAICTGMQSPVMAQEEELPQYRVEIIILRNLNPVAGTEIWPFDERLEENPAPAERFARADPADLELGEMTRRLNNSKNFRVVTHYGWVQSGYARDDARRKIVLRNAATGESVSGDFTLSRERYLRLDMDLTFRAEGDRYQMKGGRRMLSRHTHYFDHPYFGVIARITPL